MRKDQAMFSGQKINETEQRAVLHTVLRKPSGEKVFVDGQDVVPQVHEVLQKIKRFSKEFASGEKKGVTGKTLTNIVAIGIGGSYLALSTSQTLCFPIKGQMQL